jgi:hypothetical protein
MLDSRNLVKELDELSEAYKNGELDTSEMPRMRALEELIAELESYADEDPDAGITLIPEGEWVEYTKDLIAHCYGRGPLDLLDSNDWPWRHLELDYEAAADELRSDYNELVFEGTTYIYR